MYSVVDLFAGAGGLSLGFEMTKQFEVIAFVENNRNATKTYLENHPGLKNYYDIMKLNFDDILQDYPNIDVVIGGPPCQGFSNANRQRRKLINGSNELVKKYVEAIRKLRPKVFVMENVKNIASNKQSFCLTEIDKDHIKNELMLNTHFKEMTLYNRKKNVVELMNIITNKNVIDYIVINEEQLYFLKNLLRKKGKIQDFVEKKTNVRILKQILECMDNYVSQTYWYKNIVDSSKNILSNALEVKYIGDNDIEDISSFWDMQRLFYGIKELTEQKAEYIVECINNHIIVRLETYVIIEYIKKSFESLGYKVNGGVLNAANYGTPQLRERYILLGVREDVLNNEEIKLPVKIFGTERGYLTVRHAISDLEQYVPSTADMSNEMIRYKTKMCNNFYKDVILFNDTSTIYNHVCTDTTKEALERFSLIEQGKNFHSLPKEMKTNYENPERTQNTIYKRLEYNKPSDTVVNVRKSMWIHPVLNRAISAREAARLQSFPDTYKFCGTKDSVYQQIGNAVPPLLGRAVAESVLKLLPPNEDYITLKEIYDKHYNISHKS